jgi:hypothetical protein
MFYVFFSLINFSAVVFCGTEFIIIGNVVYLIQCIIFSIILIITWSKVIEWLRM